MAYYEALNLFLIEPLIFDRKFFSDSTSLGCMKCKELGRFEGFCPLNPLPKDNTCKTIGGCAVMSTVLTG